MQGSPSAWTTDPRAPEDPRNPRNPRPGTVKADRDKWNEHYRGRSCAEMSGPNALLVEWLPRLEISSPSPLAVDVACGAGRHALYLARHGWRVEAMDVSDVALARLDGLARAEQLDITCLQRDFEPEPPAALPSFGEGRYDLAVVMRYTNLPLLAAARLVAASRAATWSPRPTSGLMRPMAARAIPPTASPRASSRRPSPVTSRSSPRRKAWRPAAAVCLPRWCRSWRGARADFRARRPANSADSAIRRTLLEVGCHLQVRFATRQGGSSCYALPDGSWP